MTDLSKLTWPEAQRFFDARTIAILPTGATEPHGPHLPLDTDVTIAVAQARRAAVKLGELGVSAFVLAPLAYGVTFYTSGFAGRVTLRTGTLWAIVEDICLSLAQDGVRQLVIANAHLEPEQVKVLRNVVLDHQKRGHEEIHAILADNTRRRFAEGLGEEFKSGDCHAGRYESSLVLAADAASVRESERAKLAPLRIDLIEKMKDGPTTFKKAGALLGYCGDPARASAAEGHELNERLADIIVTLSRETWPDLFAASAPGRDARRG